MIRAPRRAVVPAGALATLVAGAAGGCVSPLGLSVPETRLRATGEYHIVSGLDVPAVRGVEGCGAQALAAVMAYENPALDAAEVADGLPWHHVGATPIDLLLAARDDGFEAAIARGTWNDVAAAARGDRPVVVMLDAAPVLKTLLGPVPGPKLMHWSVVSGVAIDGSRVLLGAPGARHHVVKREDFLNRWSKADYCLIRVRAASPAPTAPSSAATPGSR